MSMRDAMPTKLNAGEANGPEKLHIYRCRVSAYVGADGSMCRKVEFRHMKSLSTAEYPTPAEDLVESTDMVQFPENPIHGQLYYAHFIENGWDFETGCLDDWRWELVPYEESL